MAKVTMYSTGMCPFCTMAERLLASKGVAAIEKIRVDSERDYYMSAAEAKDYGLVDQVIDKRPG